MVHRLIQQSKTSLFRQVEMVKNQNQDISVILPVFIKRPSEKKIALLKRAIDSVLLQNYPSRFELLVIDDGNDTTVRDLMDGSTYLSHPCIEWIRLPYNGGLINALNIGLRNAKYEFIGRIDADDRWRDGKIEKQVRLFKQDPNLSVAGTGMVLVNLANDTKIDHVRPGDWTGILQFFVEVGCPFPHGSIIARKSIYMLLGGYSHNPRTVHAEDFSLWGRWLRFFKPAMVEEVLYEYTVSNDSVSSVHAIQQRKASEFIHRNFIALGNSMVIPEALLELSTALGVTVLEAGKFCFLVWKYQLSVTIPKHALPWLRALMPDRKIVISKIISGFSGESSLRSFGVDIPPSLMKDAVMIELLPYC